MGPRNGSPSPLRTIACFIVFRQQITIKIIIRNKRYILAIYRFFGNCGLVGGGFRPYHHVAAFNG
jgi:hypothetical protein